MYSTFVRPHLRLHTITIATIASSTVLTFAVPLVVQAYLDAVFQSGPMPPFRWVQTAIAALGGVDALRTKLWIAPLVIIVLSLLSGALSFAGSTAATTAAERSASGLRDALYDRFQAVPLSFHSRTRAGDLLQRATSDVDTARRFFSIQMLEVARAVAMIVIAVPLMTRINARLTVFGTVLLPVALVVTYYFFVVIQRAFEKSDEAEADLSAMMQEHLRGIRVVRAFGRETYEQSKFDRRNDEYRTVTARLLDRIAAYWGWSSTIVVLQLALLTLVGVVLAIRGEITTGALLAFIMLDQMLLWPIRQMGMVLADFGKARVAMRRINEVLYTPTERERDNGTSHTDLKPNIRGRVEFVGVSFGYSPDVPVLSEVSFVAEAGTTVGIMGPTGSGKSTIMMLLARLYDPHAGRILIDGVDLTGIDRVWMRSHVGFVLQESFLYARTIQENISLARHNADEAAIFNAARGAAIHDVISGFNQGYKTAVGERGVTLSGGQKQRVAIARALLSDAPILMFDDSLSAVDSHTDARIRENLVRRSATTFIVSHRVSTLMQTDNVLVIENGRVVERGSPASLLAARGPFARSYRTQFGETDDTL